VETPPSSCVRNVSFQRVGLALGLSVLTFLTFIPVLSCGFTDYDDPQYVWQNPHVLGGLSVANIRWAITATDVGYWQPLSWLSLMLDSTLWHHLSAGYHLTNLVLHAISAAVVFLVLESMTACRWRSALVAVLYAVHPLRVESVAWIAERKDVLSNLLTWLAIGGYVFYCRRPSPRRYLAVLIPFALALLAKPMAVTLPCLLLLLDYWPLERTKSGLTFFQLIKEKLPLLLLAVAAAVATVAAPGQTNAVASLAHLPVSARVVNALVGYWGYIKNMAWFADLAVIYPLRDWPPMLVLQAAAAVAGITTLAIWQRKQRPWLLVGWLWFIGVLAPVSGLVQSGFQARADRFTYLPTVGLLIMLVWSLPPVSWNSTRAWKPWLLAGVSVAMLCVCTWIQSTYWQSTETLFSQALLVTGEDNWVAHDELGMARHRAHDEAGAIAECQEAIHYFPGDPVANFNLGLSMAKFNHFREAAVYYRAALQTRPNSYEVHNALGAVLAREGDLLGAYSELRKAQDLNPNFAQTYMNFGALFIAIGDKDKALASLNQAYRLDPKDARTAHYLAVARAMTKTSPDALQRQSKAAADARD